MCQANISPLTTTDWRGAFPLARGAGSRRPDDNATVGVGACALMEGAETKGAMADLGLTLEREGGITENLALTIL